jgi:hypothetical protein
MKRLTAGLVAAVLSGLWTTGASADDWFFRRGPTYGYSYRHSALHDELEHRDYHRALIHRDAHRGPLTSWEHGRLHDSLDHAAYHDAADHRAWHRYNDYRYRPGFTIGGGSTRIRISF